MISRTHVILAGLAVASAAPAVAGPDFSPSKKGQYPSTNFNAPDVDKLTIHGTGSTGEIPNMTVGGRPLSGLLSAIPQIENGQVKFFNGPVLGTIGPDGKFTLTPEAVTAPSLTVTGPGLSGPIDSGTVGGTAIPAILGSKAPLANPRFSGTVTAPAFAGSGVASTAPRGDGALQRLDGMVPALDIARAEIPARAIILRSFVVSGYATAGDAGSGARYVRGTSSGLMAVQDAAGTWWQLDLSAGEIRAEWLGVVPNSDAAAASNASAINAGLAALGARGGGRLILPTGQIYVGSTLLNRWNYTYLDGSGLPVAPYGNPVYPTTIVPTFAGTVIKHYSDLSGNYLVNGGGLRNFRVIGNGIATRNVEINTVWDGEYRFRSEDAVGTEGVYVYGDVVAGGGSVQRMNMNISAVQVMPGAAAAANCVTFDGAATANVSINDNVRLDLAYKNGNALELKNSDNNEIYLRAFKYPGGTGRPFIARAHANPDRVARSNRLAFYSAYDGIGYVEGTEAAAYPASLRIQYLDQDNATPVPGRGTAASLAVDGITVGYTPQVTALSGTIANANVAARWSQHGHTITVTAQVNIVDNGTGSSRVMVSLPFPHNGNTPAGTVSGYQNSTGVGLTGLIYGNQAYIVASNGSYPVTGANQQLIVTLVYETY